MDSGEGCDIKVIIIIAKVVNMYLSLYLRCENKFYNNY